MKILLRKKKETSFIAKVNKEKRRYERSKKKKKTTGALNYLTKNIFIGVKFLCILILIY